MEAIDKDMAIFHQWRLRQSLNDFHDRIDVALPMTSDFLFIGSHTDGKFAQFLL